MWAQLIKAQLKPGTDLTAVADLLKTFEQPGSGLVRELFMQDQKDPKVGYVLSIFESEDKRVSASTTHAAPKVGKP